jgi:hypothetical protein
MFHILAECPAAQAACRPDSARLSLQAEFCISSYNDQTRCPTSFSFSQPICFRSADCPFPGSLYRCSEGLRSQTESQNPFQLDHFKFTGRILVPPPVIVFPIPAAAAGTASNTSNGEPRLSTYLGCPLELQVRFPAGECTILYPFITHRR